MRDGRVLGASFRMRSERCGGVAADSRDRVVSANAGLAPRVGGRRWQPARCGVERAALAATTRLSRAGTPWISSSPCAESGLEQSAKSRPAVVGNVDHLGSTRRPGHQGDVCRTTSDGLGQSRQCGGSGAPIDRRRLDGHHQGVVAVASTHPGAAGAGLDPNLHAHWHPLDAAKYRDHFAQNRRLVAVDGGVGGVVRQQPHLPLGALEGLHRRFVFE